jgi:hypothetical protein
MLNITAVNTELVFSIVNFTVVAFTVAGNSSSLFGESGSSRLIINYNTKCDHLTMIHVVQSSGCVSFSALMSPYFFVLNRIVIQYIFTFGIVIYY